MKFVLALSVVAVHAQNVPYDCPVDKKLNSTSTTLTEAGCCKSYAITCTADMCSGSKFKAVNYAEKKADCCFTKTCSIPKEFACATGKEFNGGNATSETVNSATCCTDSVPFNQSCARIDQTVTLTLYGIPLHPFDCGTQRLIYASALIPQVANKTNCCENFTATCGFQSGVLDFYEIPFACGTGKVLNQDMADNTTVNSATCCKTFVPTCGLFNPAEDSYKCPPGKILNDSASSLTTTTDSACCQNPTTCGEFAQVSSCADITCNAGYTNNKMPQGSTQFVTKQECCDITQFSGATHTVSVLAVFASLFL